MNGVLAILLAELDGKPLVRHALDAFADAPVEDEVAS